MKRQNYLRVLYAEENVDCCLMLSTLLGFSDIKIQPAHTLTEALRLAQTEEFDLYLLDTRFPEGSGFDLCRQLRQSNPQTPIIFYSGDAYEADKAKGLAAGAIAYFTKPNFADLAATILQNTKCINPLILTGGDIFPVESLHIT